MRGKLFLLVTLTGIGIISYAQNDKGWVCLPCGSACDVQIQKNPGKCTYCGMRLVEKATIRFRDLTYEEFSQQIAAHPDALILDVRSQAEFKGTTQDIPSFGHFKNAVNINITELESKINEIAGYKDKEVLVYCSHSHRSPQASYILGINGFNSVSNLTGGVSTFAGKQNDKLLQKYFLFHNH